MTSYPAKSIHLRSGKELIIRSPRKTDAQAIINHLNKIGGESDFVTFGKDEFHKSVEEESKFLTSLTNSEDHLMLIGLIDNQVIAVGDVHSNSKPRLSKFGNIAISVQKAFWRQGIGSLILQDLIKWGKEVRKLRKINLEVRSDNFRAKNLYKKLGFKKEGEITRGMFINDRFYSLTIMGLEID